MTVVNPKSISGITSITTASGSDNLLTIHTNDGTERVRVDSTGTTKIVTGIVTTLTATTGIVTTFTTNTLTANSTTKVGSGITLSPDGDVFTTGVSTFSSNVNIGVGTTGSVSITPDAAVKLSVVGTSEQDVIQITTGSVAGNGDTFANIRGDNRSGIRIRGGGSYDGGAIELAGGLRDSEPGIIKFETGTGSSVNERLRINSSGRVLVNATTSRNIGGSVTRLVQVEGTAGESGIAIARNSNNASPPVLDLAKSRSGSVGGNTIVQNGDQLGIINFVGADGTDLQTSAAQIIGEVDGTPGANDMPGRIVFKTTSDGSNSPTERLRILSTGGITFNGDTATANALDDYEEGTFTPTTSQGSLTSPEGKYIKIGSQVTIWVYIPTMSNITSTDNLHIQSLPFTGAASMVQAVGSVMMRYVNSTGIDGVSFSTYQDGGWSYVRIYSSRDDGNNYEAVRYSDFTQTTTQIRICHTYQAA